MSRLFLRITVAITLLFAIVWAAAALWIDGPESRALAGTLAGAVVLVAALGASLVAGSDHGIGAIRSCTYLVAHPDSQGHPENDQPEFGSRNRQYAKSTKLFDWYATAQVIASKTVEIREPSGTSNGFGHRYQKFKTQTAKQQAAGTWHTYCFISPCRLVWIFRASLHESLAILAACPPRDMRLFFSHWKVGATQA